MAQVIEAYELLALEAQALEAQALEAQALEALLLQKTEIPGTLTGKRKGAQPLESWNQST